MPHLGNNIKKIRQLKGIKQDDLAKELEVTQQYISKIEKGQKVSKQILQKIAEILNVSADSIIKFNSKDIA